MTNQLEKTNLLSNLLFWENEKEDDSYLLAFLRLPIPCKQQLAILKWFDIQYGNTDQDLEEWAPEFQLLTRMLIHESALLVNPQKLCLSEVIDQLKDILPSDLSGQQFIAAAGLADADLEREYSNREAKNNGFSSLSKEQSDFFKNSKVRNATGELVPVYHGTTASFDTFDTSYTGKGADQYGSGFYFASSAEIAAQYTESLNPEGPENPHILEAYLNLTNPIIIDGGKYSNLRHLEVSCEAAYKILLHHPALYLQPNNEDEMNPLCDYFESFAVSTALTTEEFKDYISLLALNFFNPTNLLLLDIFFGTYAQEFRAALYEVLGNDGIIVNYPNGEFFAIAWFPNQIKSITNLAPTEHVNINK